MVKKQNWQEFEKVLKEGRITKLYHFTDFDNLESIIQNGGLYSWADCRDKVIKIPKPGSSGPSRSLDERDHLEHYVRLSFVEDHPMKFVAMNEERISNPVVLEIDLEVALWEDTLYSDRNATRSGKLPWTTCAGRWRNTSTSATTFPTRPTSPSATSRTT